MAAITGPHGLTLGAFSCVEGCHDGDPHPDICQWHRALTVVGPFLVGPQPPS